MEAELLTAGEVATRLKVTPGYIRWLARTGQMPSVRIGVGRGSIRIPSDSLSAYVTERIPPSHNSAARVDAETLIAG